MMLCDRVTSKFRKTDYIQDMKQFIAAILILFSVPAFLFSMGGHKTTYTRISQDEAFRMMQENKNVVILDVRTPEEFSTGHIKGAVNLPNETIGKDDPASLPDKDAVILVYCRSGNRSKQAASKLSALGYTDVFEFGGVNTWRYGLVR